MSATYVAHRPDGWPLCPLCGEDELYSLAEPATIATIVGCYACGFKPDKAPRIANAARRPYRSCPAFIQAEDPWGGTYCKLAAGHGGLHSAHFPR